MFFSSRCGITTVCCHVEKNVTSPAYVNPVQVEGKLVISGWEISMEMHISDHEICFSKIPSRVEEKVLHSKRFPGLSEALQASEVI